MSSIVVATKPSRRRRVAKMRKPRLVRASPQDRTYRFTRVVSSNDGEVNVGHIALRTDGFGKPKFYSPGLAVSGSTLQIVFSLSNFDIYFDGALVSTVSVPGYTEFTGLFDEWMIEKVELMCLPTYNSHGIVSGTNVSQLPWIAFAEDNDDANSTSLNALQQFAGVKYTQLTSSKEDQTARPLCVLHPKPQMTVFRSTSTSAYSRPTKPIWIDCANNGTPHYGFKMALDEPYSGYAINTTITSINFIAKIYYAFRGVV